MELWIIPVGLILYIVAILYFGFLGPKKEQRREIKPLEWRDYTPAEEMEIGMALAQIWRDEYGCSILAPPNLDTNDFDYLENRK